MRLLVVLAFGAALTGCDDPCLVPGPADACHYAPPGEPGMFPVGVTTVTLVDHTRLDAAGQPRPLRTELWYPAAESARGAARDAYDFRDEAPAELFERLTRTTIGVWAQDAVRDAPLADDFAPFPLLVFSHGKNGLRFQTASLMVHLASHGYIVAAPDHTNDTLWELLATGNLDPGGIVQSLVDRPRDVTFVARTLAEDGGPLGAAVDGRRYGVFGHSFGGAVSVMLAAAGSEFHDPRVVASLPLAPAVRIVDLLGAGTAAKAVPMLILGGERDETTGYENEQVFGYQTAPAPRGLVGIIDAGHFSFTELCDLDLVAVAAELGFDASDVLDDGCGDAFIAPPLMRRVQGYFAAAFFNAALRRSGAASRDLDPAALPADVRWQVDYVEDGLAHALGR